MKKFLLFVLILLSIFLGYSFAKDKFSKGKPQQTESKTPILKFALVADSHNQNDLLTKALNQAKGEGASFVVGLGDWSNVGIIKELTDAKKMFDGSGLNYFVTAGDHDLWDSRNSGDALANFRQVFGKPTHDFTKNGIQFVILDNSDIYSGIDSKSWDKLVDTLDKVKSISGQTGENSKSEIRNSKRTFVFAHKTPFHPQSSHIMGEDNAEVSRQARKLTDLLEEKRVDGFFSGDLHFFAQFNSPASIVRMTTIGAVASEKNFQGPRFAVVTVYNDYSFDVQDVEIR